MVSVCGTGRDWELRRYPCADGEPSDTVPDRLGKHLGGDQGFAGPFGASSSCSPNCTRSLCHYFFPYWSELCSVLPIDGSARSGVMYIAGMSVGMSVGVGEG
jgi:hypothetical protein